MLAGIDLARLGGFDCVEVLQAQYRQLNHERARLMATMVEVGLAGMGPDDEPWRVSAPDEFSADEVRAALVLTRRAAEAQFWTAHDLLTRLPGVHAAMAAGGATSPGRGSSPSGPPTCAPSRPGRCVSGCCRGWGS